LDSDARALIPLFLCFGHARERTLGVSGYSLDLRYELADDGREFDVVGDLSNVRPGTPIFAIS